MSSWLRRIAEAASEMFLLDVEAGLSPNTTQIEFASKNLEAMHLARAATAVFGPLFAAHLETATRNSRRAGLVSTDYEMVTLAIGFVDLSGFTSSAAEMPPSELLELVLAFEGAAYDLVGECDGRVVKLIGDEVMFTAVTAPAACDIALGLLARTADGGTRAKGGIAFGPVVAHGGDVYGHTVNLAARIVDTSVPGEVLVEQGVVANAPQQQFLPAGRRMLKGIADPVQLWSITS